MTDRKQKGRSTDKERERLTKCPHSTFPSTVAICHPYQCAGLGFLHVDSLDPVDGGQRDAGHDGSSLLEEAKGDLQPLLVLLLAELHHAHDNLLQPQVSLVVGRDGGSGMLNKVKGTSAP